MKDILNKLLDKWLCKHDWELFETHEVYTTFEFNMPEYHVYIFICKKCGKIKKVQVK